MLRSLFGLSARFPQYAHSYRSLTLGLSAFVLAAGMAPHTAHAQAGKPHVHGEAELNVAVEHDMLTLILTTPLDNLTGFEHAPRTPAQHEAARKAVERLTAADTLFEPDPKAECILDSVDLDSPLLAHIEQTAIGQTAASSQTQTQAQVPTQAHTNSQASHQTQPHTHSTIDASAQQKATASSAKEAHEHESHAGHSPKKHPDSAHSDLELTAIFNCENATTAQFINPTLFTAFPRFQAVKVQVVSPSGQTGSTVKRSTPRIDLKP